MKLIKLKREKLLRRLKQDEEFIKNMKKMNPNEISHELNRIKNEKTNENISNRLHRLDRLDNFVGPDHLEYLVGLGCLDCFDYC